MPNHLADVFREAAEKNGDKPAFYSKDDQKKYQSISYKELYETGLNLAEALIDLGVQARDHVALLADNRLEWIICDYGVILAGAADVPRGTDITDSEIVHILNHSKAEIAFVEHDKMLEKFQRNKSQLPKVKTIIMMDPKSKASGVLKLGELVEKGKKLREGGSKKAEERMQGIKPDDLFTLIYTSGTTGLPKGVMLMHSNMVHQVTEVTKNIPVTSQDRVLSILPVWHIFERVFEYITIRVGGATYYTNVRDLRQDFLTVKPTFMGSAPRLWENVYNGIYTRVNDPKQTPAIRRILFKTAYFISSHYKNSMTFLKGNLVDYHGRNILETLGLMVKSLFNVLVFGPFTMTIIAGVAGYLLKDSVPQASIPLYVIAALGLILNAFTLDKIVMSTIRMATGGALKASVSGGGALPRHVDEFFNNIGINVLEGYGMTETCPVISVRSFDKLVIGSVGPIVPQTTVQIRNDSNEVLTELTSKGEVKGSLGKRGVVFVKGAQVMKGYYDNQEATKKALVDGWMNTGDIGMINFKKTLTLTGRAKETIVLLGGENVEPVPIENKLQESDFINQVMVIGQDQKNLGAIIVPDFTKLEEWCSQNGIQEKDHDKLIENPKVLELYKKEIKTLNNSKNGFKSFEQVTPFCLISKPFEVGDEMTNLMKMKRHVITEKYKDKIKKIYV